MKNQLINRANQKRCQWMSEARFYTCTKERSTRKSAKKQVDKEAIAGIVNGEEIVRM